MLVKKLAVNSRRWTNNNVSVMVAAISTVLMIMFPVPSLLFNFFGMILMKGAFRKYYAFLFAFSLSIIAYVWVPDSSMDLHRHHYDVNALAGYNFERLGIFMKANLEPFHYFLKFIIGQTGDYNLLQLVVVFLGYSGLFWMICDMAEMKKCRRSILFLLCTFAFSTIRFIDFASGLWFNFSVICISLGVYMDCYKKKKRLSYAFYLIAACSHVGTIYAILLVIAIRRIKLFRKVRPLVLIILFLVMLSFGGIVFLANNIFGSDFALVAILNRMYDGYFVNGAQFEELHTGWSLYLSLTNIALCVALGVWHYIKSAKADVYDCLIIYLAIAIVATIFGAGVFIRFKTLIVILTLPVLISCFEESKNRILNLSLLIVLVLLSLMQLYRAYIQAQSAGLFYRVDYNITHNVFNLSVGDD